MFTTTSTGKAILRPRTTIAQTMRRYPNLITACCFVAQIKRKEAAIVVWAYRQRITTPVGTRKVIDFGGHDKIIEQAIRYRNY